MCILKLDSLDVCSGRIILPPMQNKMTELQNVNMFKNRMTRYTAYIMYILMATGLNFNFSQLMQ